MPILIALSGQHNSGKTTLGVYLLQRLTDEGYKVAVVKSTKETGLITDQENTDTHRYKKAGAKAVVLLQRDLATLYCSPPMGNKEELLSWVRTMFWNYDLVILEGFKTWKGIPKIWILKEGEAREDVLKYYPNVELMIGLEERDRAYEFVLRKLEERQKEEVNLWVEGKEIYLKPFIQVILKEIVLGFLKGLKGVPKEVDQIEVRIKAK
ncbi:MAG: molybdopterin-guanine dinucleotide biosynthesis protein MobB [Caldimicrobium sp.]|nr:molybdopterin-guanine dinucleotide biosynthesis protein MobB [Caldimicrobium sp.]MCX7873101.1 molybdopterin-guanine dinucleotide biosynthesis protein MobB [Caldimicrobium sp.]MDW8094526.1 molybdopterin-guanine dinucleotide biosynthesis protein MobB [Caldimicrobium sp.]